MQEAFCVVKGICKQVKTHIQVWHIHLWTRLDIRCGAKYTLQPLGQIEHTDTRNSYYLTWLASMESLYSERSHDQRAETAIGSSGANNVPWMHRDRCLSLHDQTLQNDRTLKAGYKQVKTGKTINTKKRINIERLLRTQVHWLETLAWFSNFGLHRELKR